LICTNARVSWRATEDGEVIDAGSYDRERFTAVLGGGPALCWRPTR
jgi:hypothetical protein